MPRFKIGKFYLKIGFCDELFAEVEEQKEQRKYAKHRHTSDRLQRMRLWKANRNGKRKNASGDLCADEELQE